MNIKYEASHGWSAHKLGLGIHVCPHRDQSARRAWKNGWLQREHQECVASGVVPANKRSNYAAGIFRLI